MQSRWHREGQFSEIEEKIRPADIKYVLFKNTENSVTIKKIRIEFHDSGLLRFFINPSVLNEDKIARACLSYFPTGCNTSLKSQIMITVKMTHQDALKKLTDMLAYLNLTNKENQNKKITEFTPELIKDISSISERLQGKNPSWNIGTAPEHSDQSITVNPLLESSTALVKKLRIHNITVSKVQSFLQSGEDPNQEDAIGNLPLTTAVTDNPELVKLLLWYGGDPTHRPLRGVFSDNAIEKTIKLQMPDMFDILQSSIATPRTTPLNQKQITHINLDTKNNEIVTHLEFIDGVKMTARMMSTKKFHEPELANEKSQLLTLFKKTFEDCGGDLTHVESNFEIEFAYAPNKWITLICGPDEKVWGLNLFRIVQVQNKWVCKCEYAAYDQDTPLRNKGLAPFFAFSIPITLQTLMPKDTVIIYYLALHYFSYCAMKGILATPKYRSEAMDNMNQELVTQEFGHPIELSLGGSISDPGLLRVKGSNRKGKNFDEDCYHDFIQIPEDKKIENNGQAAVVATPVGDEHFASLEKYLGAMGVDFKQYVQQLGELFTQNKDQFFTDWHETPILSGEPSPSIQFGSQRWPFWTNEKKPIGFEQKEESLSLTMSS